MQLSRIRLIRRKMGIKTKTIWVKYYVTLKRVCVIIIIKKSFCKALPKIFKNLVLILAIFTSIIKAGNKDKVVLKEIVYIYYSIWFKKNKSSD